MFRFYSLPLVIALLGAQKFLVPLVHSRPLFPVLSFKSVLGILLQRFQSPALLKYFILGISNFRFI